MDDENAERRLSQTDPLGIHTLKVFRTPTLVHADAIDIEDERLTDLSRTDSNESAQSNQCDDTKSPRIFKKNPRASAQRSSRFTRKSSGSSGSSRNSSSRGSVSFSQNLTIISEDQSASENIDRDVNENKRPPVFRSLLNDVVEETDSSDTEGTDSDDGHNEQYPPEIHFGITPRRGSRWSVNYLRNEFRKVCIDDLYRRYWVRLQRILLFKLLLTLIGQNIFIIILYNILKPRGYVSTMQINIMIACCILAQCVAAILIFTKKVYMKGFKYIGSLVWISCIAPLFLGVVPAIRSHSNVLPMDNVAAVFYVIFITHTMLPFSRKVSLSLGILTGIMDLVVSTVLSNTTTRVLCMQVTSNFLIYACSNITGLYHKHLTDIAHRHTFLDTRNFLEADLKYCRQKEKHNGLRESLLSKVIPNHLINKMMGVIKEKFKNLDEHVVRTFALTRKLSVHFKHPTIRGLGHSNTKSAIKDPQRRKKASLTESADGSDSGDADNLLVERHDNVSILYADIVSFTPLTSEMNSAELVRALNELFGKFDVLAKSHGCTRIKMLGDCYYCVSGLPEKDENHAKNCVKMGLEMIKVIRDIRAKTGVEKLDMRIGVHSGCVYSGVIGLRKWQYDIWSDDVITANHMESGGQAGKVHITKATLDELNSEFKATPADGHLRDEYLQKHNIETFFIEEKENSHKQIERLDPMTSDKLRRQPSLTRRFSMYVESFGAQLPFNSLSDYMLEKHLPASIEVNRRLERAFQLDDDEQEVAEERSKMNVRDKILDAFRQVFQQIKGEGIAPENSPTQRLTQPHTTYENSFQRRGINAHPITLTFPQKEHEKQYLNKRDSTYKFYIFCAFVIFLFMGIVQLLTLVRSVSLYVSFIFGFLVYITLTVMVTGLKFLGKSAKKCISNDCLMWLSNTSETLISEHLWKSIICIISSLTMFMASIVPVLNCHNARLYLNETMSTASVDGITEFVTYPEQHWTTYDPTTGNTTMSVKGVEVNSAGFSVVIDDPEKAEILAEDLIPCLFAPYYIFSCIAVMVGCSVFLRVNHLLKIGLIFCFAVCFNVMFHLVFHDIFQIYDEHMQFAFLPCGYRGTIHTTVFFLTLVVLDRQIERNLRLDFLCRIKIEEEKNEVRKKELYNELLLANMLPQHVVEHYLIKPTRKPKPNDELYHQHCKNTCIMFASIPNLMAYFAANGITGRESLEILNDTISAFDHLEMTKRFQKVEKIKIIGSTFMAATGLNVIDDTEENSEEAADNVALMVNFAWAMMTTLKKIRLLGDLQLRVGINHGEVIAGVVGAQKPQYDIWGDAVNIASRMESTGILGKIQVPEGTADLLTRRNIPCQYRDRINVKGKGRMKVYTVKDYPRIRPRVSVCSMDPANLIFNDLWSHSR